MGIRNITRKDKIGAVMVNAIQNKNFKVEKEQHDHYDRLVAQERLKSKEKKEHKHMIANCHRAAMERARQ